jgi:hypothetical protein
VVKVRVRIVSYAFSPMRRPYPTFPKLTKLIVWQEPDPGTNGLHAAFTH